MSEARKRKNRRLKQAKEEAQEEIQKYKAERETTFKVIFSNLNIIDAVIFGKTRTKVVHKKVSQSCNEVTRS